MTDQCSKERTREHDETTRYDPVVMRAAGSRRVFFSAFNGPLGRELWVTDGTPGGTRLVADLAHGAGSSDPDHLFVWNGRLLFDADDGVHGREPFALPIGAVSTIAGVPSGYDADTFPKLEGSDPVLGRTMYLYGRDAQAGAFAATVLGLPTGETIYQFRNALYVGAPAVWNIVPTSGGRWQDQIPVPAIPVLQGLTVAIQSWLGPSVYGFDYTNAVHATLGY